MDNTQLVTEALRDWATSNDYSFGSHFFNGKRYITLTQKYSTEYRFNQVIGADLSMLGGMMEANDFKLISASQTHAKDGKGRSYVMSVTTWER